MWEKLRHGHLRIRTLFVLLGVWFIVCATAISAQSNRGPAAPARRSAEHESDSIPSVVHPANLDSQGLVF